VTCLLHSLAQGLASSQLDCRRILMLCNSQLTRSPGTMFRRLPQSLPPDPVFPSNLSELGYFVNDQDQIRQIESPDQRYTYRVNINERVNDVYRSAMNSKLLL
jgi:hypothetical protein